LPPTVLFDAKKVSHTWTSGEIPGTSYGCSDKGWINTDLFESWVSDHFIKHVVAAQPLLLLLDGDSTHHQPEIVHLARSKQILMLCLPPHTTREAQPLDYTVFAPLKSQWRAVCHEFLQRNPGRVILPSLILIHSFQRQSVIPANVIAGFKSCAVYPFNSTILQLLKLYPYNSETAVQQRKVQQW